MDWALYGYPDVDRQSPWKSLKGLQVATNEIPGISPPFLWDRFSSGDGITSGFVFDWIVQFDIAVGDFKLQKAANALGETIITAKSLKKTNRIVPYLQQRYRFLNYLIENK